MAKFKLDIEYDYDFILIGISCHLNDYRITWAIGKAFEFQLEKSPKYLEGRKKKDVEPSGHSIYEYIDEENYLEYYVISNRGEQSFLIPEQKQADYFLMVRGTVSSQQKDEFTERLRKIDIIQMVYEINPEQLKSKENLLF